ncbi:MAG: ATPase, T2SS/T4P/T4SS family, partial [Amylibacter sp.]
MFKRYSKPATKNPTSIKDTAQPAVIKPVADISIEKPKDILPTITPVVAPVSSDGQVKDQKRKDRLIDVRMQMHKRLLETLNLAAIDKASESDLRREISAVTIDGLQEIGIVLNKAERDHLVQELVDEVTGLGPLEPLLRDDDIADILINGHKQIFIEKKGKLTLSDVRFADEKHLLRVIDKIVSAVGRRVDESNPYVDARLQDGSRFNAIVPPIAVD